MEGKDSSRGCNKNKDPAVETSLACLRNQLCAQCGYSKVQTSKSQIGGLQVVGGHVFLAFIGHANDFGFSSERHEQGSECSEQTSDKDLTQLKASLATALKTDHRGQSRRISNQMVAASAQAVLMTILTKAADKRQNLMCFKDKRFCQCLGCEGWVKKGFKQRNTLVF